MINKHLDFLVTEVSMCSFQTSKSYNFQKERRKKRAEELQIQKQKEREAKKRSIKRKLEFKAKKNAAIVFLASKGMCNIIWYSILVSVITYPRSFISK